MKSSISSSLQVESSNEHWVFLLVRDVKKEATKESSKYSAESALSILEDNIAKFAHVRVGLKEFIVVEYNKPKKRRAIDKCIKTLNSTYFTENPFKKLQIKGHTKALKILEKVCQFEIPRDMILAEYPSEVIDGRKSPKWVKEVSIEVDYNMSTQMVASIFYEHNELISDIKACIAAKFPTASLITSEALLNDFAMKKYKKTIAKYMQIKAIRKQDRIGDEVMFYKLAKFLSGQVYSEGYSKAQLGVYYNVAQFIADKWFRCSSSQRPISFILQGKRSCYKTTFVKTLGKILGYAIWEDGKKLIAPEEISAGFISNSEGNLDTLFSNKFSSDANLKAMLKVANGEGIQMNIKYIDPEEVWKGKGMIIDTNAELLCMSDMYLKLKESERNFTARDRAQALQERFKLFKIENPNGDVLPVKWHLEAQQLAWTIYNMLPNKFKINALLGYDPCERTLTALSSEANSRTLPFEAIIGSPLKRKHSGLAFSTPPQELMSTASKAGNPLPTYSENFALSSIDLNEFLHEDLIIPNSINHEPEEIERTETRNEQLKDPAVTHLEEQIAALQKALSIAQKESREYEFEKKADWIDGEKQHKP